MARLTGAGDLRRLGRLGDAVFDPRVKMPANGARWPRPLALIEMKRLIATLAALFVAGPACAQAGTTVKEAGKANNVHKAQARHHGQVANAAVKEAVR